MHCACSEGQKFVLPVKPVKTNFSFFFFPPEFIMLEKGREELEERVRAWRIGKGRRGGEGGD